MFMVELKRMRCSCCNKRLNAICNIVSKCRCGNLFCHNHMHSHNCMFDYRSLDKITISSSNLNKISNVSSNNGNCAC